MKKKNRVRASAEQPMVTNDPRVALELNNDGLIKALDVCCPVCVYSYDREKHTAKVLPLVKQAFFKTKWEYINAQTFEVRVRSIQCGGFCVDIPLFVGDTGWVFSSDRDMTFLRAEDSETVKVLYKDCKKQEVEDGLTKEPMRPILHSLQDGFFIPDNWGKWDYLKFKDSDNIPLPTSMYIGTSLHENYKEKPSCSVSFGHDGKLHLMASQSQSVDDNGRTHVELDGEKLKVTVDRSNKRGSLSKKFTLDYEHGATLEINTDSASRRVVKVDDEGIKFNIFDSERGNPTELFMAKDGKISVITDSDVYLKGRDVKADCEKISVVGKVEVTGDGVTVKSKNVEVASAENVIVQSGGSVEVNAGSSVQVNSGNGCTVRGSGFRVIGEDVSVAASRVTMTATGTARIDGNTIEMLGSTIDIKGGSLKLNGRQIMAGSDIIDALQN